MLKRGWRKGNPLHCWWQCKLVQPLWRTIWRFLKKLKIELPYDPAILLLGIYLKKTMVQKDTCTTMFIEALFTVAKTWKQLKCLSTDEWIRRRGTYIQWSIIRSLKKWNNAICSNMVGPRDYHTKWSKTDRERQISYDIVYMWNLKKKMIQTNLFTKQKQTHRLREQT